MQAHIQFCLSTRARLNISSIFFLGFPLFFLFFSLSSRFFNFFSFCSGSTLLPTSPLATPLGVCHLYDKIVEQIYVQIMDAFSCVFISKCVIVSKNPQISAPISAPHITMVHYFYCTLDECMGFIINLCHLVLKHMNIYHTFWFLPCPAWNLVINFVYLFTMKSIDNSNLCHLVFR